MGKSLHPAQVERFQTVYNLEVGYLHTCAQSSAIHSSQKVEATQVSTEGPTDKQTAMYPCNGILLSPQNAVNPDTGYSVEGSEDIILGEKKTRAAGLHLYEVPGAVRSVETKSRLVGLGGEQLGVGAAVWWGQSFSFT